MLFPHHVHTHGADLLPKAPGTQLEGPRQPGAPPTGGSERTDLRSARSALETVKKTAVNHRENRAAFRGCATHGTDTL